MGKRGKVSATARQASSLQDAAQRAERRYVLNHQPVTNLDKVITFDLDGLQMVRRLVAVVRQIGQEISIASPVGFRLANAQPGQSFELNSLDGSSVVKVLAIL